MKTHRHRRHSTGFKLRIVQAYLKGEESIKEIARQHDISHNLLFGSGSRSSAAGN